MQIGISHKQDKNMVSGSLLERKHVKELYITHDQSDGKDLVEVKVNNEVIFRYDANFKGDGITVNHIQMTKEEYENKFLPGLCVEKENDKVINREMVYILTQVIIEDYNKRFYNLGVYKSLELANKRLDDEIEHDIEFNNVKLSNRDEMSANLNNDWINVVYRIDAQIVE